jgi:hypothetical protein
MNQMTFMVAYDYGTGGLWGFVRAESEEEIHRVYPELVIVHERPAWMTDESYAQMEQRETYDLGAPPTGMLKAIVADRDRV